MNQKLALIVAAAAAASACGPDDPGAGQCELGVATAAVEAADRKILGVAAPYPADGMLRGREAALLASQAERRAVGWETVARVLSPVAIAQPLPNFPGEPVAVPRWQTWYGRDDMVRLFHHLYEGLSPDERRARVRFSDERLDAALAWNVHAVEELPNWPEDRWQAYLAAIDEAAEVAGVGGIDRVGYGPAAARHMLASYREILACMAAGTPPPFADGPSSGTRTLVREGLALDACAERSYGPYYVAGGETLRASFEGSRDAAAGAVVRVRPIATPEVPSPDFLCEGGPELPCEIQGPGGFTVTVTAGTIAVDATLKVEYDEASPTWAACLERPFDGDAVVVKADWRRAGLGIKLPVYDTSAAGLTKRLGPDADATWGTGDSEADPGAEEIYTLKLPNGNVFRLAALHIMTKELDHWTWTTLWWSATPDDDFGADRPAAIAALGPWGHYKMCTVTGFTERDPDPSGGFGASAPSLAASLTAAHGGAGGPSWCSNPYLEEGHGNARTNCMGCHQHGGTSILAEDILADPVRFPDGSRRNARNNFPADYSWATDSGDKLGSMMKAEVDYWDTAD